MKNKRLIICVTILAVLLFAGGLVLSFLNSPFDGSKSGKGLFDGLLASSSKDPVNILVLVGDKVGSNTDTIMLVNYNPSTAKMSMLSIPRDTKVSIKGSKVPKINSAYAAGGAKRSIQAVEDLLGVNIKYYVYFNISTVKKVVDLVDGVQFEVPVDLKYDDPAQNLHIDLKKGLQVLDGDKAEQLLRFRKPQSGRYSKELLKYYDGSDLNRIGMQQKFIKELIKQKANIKYISKMDDILKEVFKNVKTNMSMNDAMKLAYNASKLNSENVNSFTISGDSQNKNGYYFIYNKKIRSSATGKTEDASQVIPVYFSSKGAAEAELKEVKAVDDKKEAGDKTTPKVSKNNNVKKAANNSSKTSFTKDNPSNKDTSVKGTSTPKP